MRPMLELQQDNARLKGEVARLTAEIARLKYVAPAHQASAPDKPVIEAGATVDHKSYRWKA